MRQCFQEFVSRCLLFSSLLVGVTLLFCITFLYCSSHGFRKPAAHVARQCQIPASSSWETRRPKVILSRRDVAGRIEQLFCLLISWFLGVLLRKEWTRTANFGIKNVVHLFLGTETHMNRKRYSDQPAIDSSARLRCN